MEKITINFSEEAYYIRLPRDMSYSLEVSHDRIQIIRWTDDAERKENRIGRLNM
jgi:hypothetical protein